MKEPKHPIGEMYKLISNNIKIFFSFEVAFNCFGFVKRCRGEKGTIWNVHHATNFTDPSEWEWKEQSSPQLLENFSLQLPLGIIGIILQPERLVYGLYFVIFKNQVDKKM